MPVFCKEFSIFSNRFFLAKTCLVMPISNLLLLQNIIRKEKQFYILITTVKHAIWLVNSRAGSGYPAREITMPSRDFHRILKMSLFHCSYSIKQLPNGFPSRIAWSMHALAWDVARLSGSVKIHSPAVAEYFYVFRKSRDIPRVFFPSKFHFVTAPYYVHLTKNHSVFLSSHMRSFVQLNVTTMTYQ
jgi:hypothetical protein